MIEISPGVFTATPEEGAAFKAGIARAAIENEAYRVECATACLIERLGQPGYLSGVRPHLQIEIPPDNWYEINEGWLPYEVVRVRAK